MNPINGNGADAANAAPAKEITNTRILPPAYKLGKSAMLPVEHGGFLAEIGGASWN